MTDYRVKTGPVESQSTLAHEDWALIRMALALYADRLDREIEVTPANNPKHVLAYDILQRLRRIGGLIERYLDCPPGRQGD